MQETHIQPLGPEDPWEKGMATHSNILAWEIPRTEEPGGLQSMGSQRVVTTERLNNWEYYSVVAYHIHTPQSFMKIRRLQGVRHYCLFLFKKCCCKPIN